MKVCGLVTTKNVYKNGKEWLLLEPEQDEIYHCFKSDCHGDIGDELIWCEKRLSMQ